MPKTAANPVTGTRTVAAEFMAFRYQIGQAVAHATKPTFVWVVIGRILDENGSGIQRIYRVSTVHRDGVTAKTGEVIVSNANFHEVELLPFDVDDPMAAGQNENEGVWSPDNDDD